MDAMKLKAGAPCSGRENRAGSHLSSRLSVRRDTVFELLKQLAEDNERFFSKSSSYLSYSKRVEDSCCEIALTVSMMQEFVGVLQQMAPQYDFDDDTPGNGFRSLVCVCDMVVLHLVSVLRDCSELRETIMFRASYYCKEVEGYGAVMRFLIVAIQQVIMTAKQLPEGSLFPSLDGDYSKYQAYLKGIEALDSSCFYGRPLGFQFVPSVGRIFRFIGVILATYSLSWEKGHGAIGSLLNSGRFILSPEQRASRIVKVTREADIEFCKGFWNLSEFGNVPKLFCPNMSVNEVREINWVGPITMATTQGGTVRIPEPCSHTGVRPVRVRILSYAHREILSPLGAPNQLPPSPYLLFHCHGGGYVATSSKSHETYLRTWAKLLNCTVVSVDYSLAPENPFPRPTEEVLYAYAYIINNAAQLGWTGEKICMVGDSAGGNLIMSVNLRLAHLDVRRKPDGLVLVYTPFLFQYLPSPSRLLSFMDPLLHTGVVLRCVAAYTHGCELNKEEEERNSPGGTERNGHKSLQEYVEQVQRAQKCDSGSSTDLQGSSSIVSLVNLYQENGSSEGAASQGPPAKTAKASNEALQKCSSSEEEDDSDDDNTSLSAVQINSDPLRIHLSSSVCDRQLVDYLKVHPLTKDSLVLMDGSEVSESAAVKKENSLPSTKGAQPYARPSKLVTLLCSSLGASPVTTPMTSEVSTSQTMVTSQSSQNIIASNGALSHKRSLSQSLADTAALAAGHALDNLTDWLEKSASVSVTDKAKLDRAASLTPQMAANMQRLKTNRLPSDSYLAKLLKQKVPRDALISPMYATAEELCQLPPMWLVACHLDPLLDDTISFARKARDCGAKVMAVDLLDSLPHGFLNFTLMSPECREGAKLCLNRIKIALGMGDHAV